MLHEAAFLLLLGKLIKSNYMSLDFIFFADTSAIHQIKSPKLYLLFYKEIHHRSDQES